MSEQPTAPKRIDPRLCIMMFLQYAVWGIWMPILPVYLSSDPANGGLGFSGHQVGWILATALAIGTMSAPFIAGQIADRYFASQRYLGVCMLLGGGVIWTLAYQESFAVWMALATAYALIYMPTLGLTNSLAMAHLDDTERQFAKVRLWGTIGWIAVAWFFPMLWLVDSVEFQWLPPFYDNNDVADATARIADALKASGILSVGYGIFCFFLPHTPPRPDAVKRLAFAGAASLLRYRSILVLVLAWLPLAAIHKIYFLQTSPYLKSIGLSESYIMPAMSIGQFAEIAVMAILGWMISYLGFRRVLMLGAGAFLLRYGIFGTIELPLGLIVAAQFLHGFCFACAWATAFIYIDRMAPTDVRHSAQTGFIIIQLGIGAILGGELNGLLEWLYTTGGEVDYRLFWYTCAGIAGACGLAIALAFRDQAAVPEPEPEPAVEEAETTVGPDEPA